MLCRAEWRAHVIEGWLLVAVVSWKFVAMYPARQMLVGHLAMLRGAELAFRGVLG
jgi:hypothetical protein